MNPVVSVVVPTFNRSRSLRRLLRALDDQTLEADAYEVVVVDDGSSDETPAVLAATTGVRTVRQPNGGPNRARNRGIREAEAQLIAFIDDDCVPAPDWLELLVRAADAAAESAVGFGGEIQPLERGFVQDFVQAERVVRHGRGPTGHGDLDYLVTANALYRANALHAVGGFDADLSNGSGEDVDLSYRLRARGGRLESVQTAVVQHDHVKEIGSLLRIYRRSGHARTLLAQRHDDLSLGSGAGTALSPRAWLTRIADYRSAGAPRRRLPAYVCLRVVCLISFVFGAMEARS